MILCSLNPPIIRDICKMSRLGRFTSFSSSFKRLSTSRQDSCSSQRNFAIRRCIRENLKRRQTVPSLYGIVRSRAIIVVVVPQWDFLGSQPDSSLEVLMELVDKVGNTTPSSASLCTRTDCLSFAVSRNFTSPKAAIQLHTEMSLTSV